MLRSIKRVLTIYILGQNGETPINPVNPSSDTHETCVQFEGIDIALTCNDGEI